MGHAEVLGQFLADRDVTDRLPSPVHNDFSDVDQVGPQESSMSLKIRRAVAGSCGSSASSSSSTGANLR